MKTVKVFCDDVCGKVKPMHAVNNGPVYKFTADQRITNIDAFREAGIPYARNHDAAFYATYGGEHTVDVHNIFPNFDADPYDENSYDFACTDEYVKVTDYAGVKTFYRLGSKIEHGVKKYGTRPPKDFKKWAVICEHIIRHYTEGWANGFHYDMEYWEIWNEPDGDPTDTLDPALNATWGGTSKQFYELFNITLTHLKRCFPNLKIGGPALGSLYNTDWLRKLFSSLETKPDFFSWHIYCKTIDEVEKACFFARQLLDEYGLTETESILNEWNYVKGWIGDEWITSLKAMKSLKGASFIAGTMSVCQYSPLDMLMYYDARPSGMNGMFSTDLICIRLKGYYPFKMFGTLYRYGDALRVDRTDAAHIYASAAKSSDGQTGVMLTYFDDDETEAFCDVELKIEGAKEGQTAEIYLLDETHDGELIRTARVGDTLNLRMTLFSTVFVRLA